MGLLFSGARLLTIGGCGGNGDNKNRMRVMREKKKGQIPQDDDRPMRVRKRYEQYHIDKATELGLEISIDELTEPFDMRVERVKRWKEQSAYPES